MTLACLSGHAPATRTLPSVPDGAGRSAELVLLERALGWSRGRLAARLGVPNHQVRRWRMRGEAELEGREPSPDSREAPPWAVATLRALVALSVAAPNLLWALDTRAALAEVLADLETPARFRGDRRPGEYADVRDGADEC